MAKDINRPFRRSYNNILVDFVDLETLIDIVWKTKRGV